MHSRMPRQCASIREMLANIGKYWKILKILQVSKIYRLRGEEIDLPPVLMSTPENSDISVYRPIGSHFYWTMSSVIVLPYLMLVRESTELLLSIFVRLMKIYGVLKHWSQFPVKQYRLLVVQTRGMALLLSDVN